MRMSRLHAQISPAFDWVGDIQWGREAKIGISRRHAGGASPHLKGFIK